MSPQGNTLQAVTFTNALRLCERGDYALGYEAAQSLPGGPERSLIEGASLGRSDYEAAKDRLSIAARSLDGELGVKAHAWLACCYWATGERDEAWITIRQVTPETDEGRFVWHLMVAIFSSGEGKLKQGQKHLQEIESLVDSVNPLWRGKFFNERAYQQRRLSHRDQAILNYTAAIIAFEELGNEEGMRSAATAGSNLGGVYIDANKLEQAAQVISKSIVVNNHLGCFEVSAMALDQLAQVHLASGDYELALTAANEAVENLKNTERREWLAECLITRSKIFMKLNRYALAFADLHEAEGLAIYLNNEPLLLTVLKEIRELATSYEQESHLRLVKLALKLADGGLRKAARLIGCSPPPLDRYIKNHHLDRHLKVTKSLNSKPRK